jgi:drug/metabolite transporter (DMT)-like permease
MAYVFAVLASFTNALSSILQRIGIQNAPDRDGMDLSLIAYGLRRGVWILGFALVGVGFILQALALRFGQLTSVQPVITAELLFLVLILGVWFRYPVGLREWTGAFAAAGGLAAFLLIARPGGGTAVPTLRSWTFLFVVVGVLAAAAGAAAQTGPRWFRASMFGASAALLFAVSAALTKDFTTLITQGWGHVFAHWEPYAMLGTGLVGVLLAQNAFHAGPITASQATMTIVDPLASVVIGIALFHDHVSRGSAAVTGEVLAMLVMFGGVVLLAQSPLVTEAKDETGSTPMLERQPSRRGHRGDGRGRPPTDPGRGAETGAPPAAAVPPS